MKNQNENNKIWQDVWVDRWCPQNVGDSIEGEIETLDRKELPSGEVPYVRLITDTGDLVEVLMGQASLQALYFSGQLKVGGRLGLYYNGESKNIEKMGNFAKMYKFFYIPPGETDPVKIRLNSTQQQIGATDQQMEKLKKTAESNKAVNKKR